MAVSYEGDYSETGREEGRGAGGEGARGKVRWKERERLKEIQGVRGRMQEEERYRKRMRERDGKRQREAMFCTSSRFSR